MCGDDVGRGGISPVRVPDRPIALRSPLVRSGPLRVSFWEFFERGSASVHARGRHLARSGVHGFAMSRRGDRWSVRAAVRSSRGLVTVILEWSSHRPVPSRMEASCPCPFRRPWCKHAMAAAYHLVDRLER